MIDLDRLETRLHADLAAALGVSPDAVYLGEQPQRVQRGGLEVWIEPTGSERPEVDTVLLRYELRLRLKTRPGARRTGAEPALTLRQHAETLRERYDGTRAFANEVPQVVACALEVLDANAEDTGYEQSVELRVLVQ